MNNNPRLPLLRERRFKEIVRNYRVYMIFFPLKILTESQRI